MLTDDSTGLIVADKLGRTRGALAVQPDGATGLDFLDTNEKARLKLDLTAEGAAFVTLVGEKGQILQRLPAGH